MTIEAKAFLTASTVPILFIGMTAAALLLLTGSARADAPPPGGGPRMISGKVIDVDTKADAITITGPDGDDCTINVSHDTVIHGLASIKASELGKGEKVLIDGTFSAITARSIIAGDIKDAMPGAPSGRRGDYGFGGRRPDPGDDSDDGARTDDDRGGRPTDFGAPGPRESSDMSRPRPLMGTITAIHPLTISMSDPGQGGVTITVSVRATAKVGKVVTETLADIKVGDRVYAAGDPNDDGSLDATKIAVNIAAPRRGPGRRGGEEGRPPFRGDSLPFPRGGLGRGSDDSDGRQGETDRGFGPPPPFGGDQGGPPPLGGGDQGGPPPPGGGDQGGPPPIGGGADQGGPPPPGGF